MNNIEKHRTIPNTYFLRKGEAVPHAPGTVVYKATGKQYELVGECPCTDWPLHYIVRNSSGRVMTVQHKEIMPVDNG